VPKEIEAGAALANCRAQINQINARLSAEKTFVNFSSAAELLFILSLPLLLSKRPRHPREIAERRNDAQFAYLPDEQTCIVRRATGCPICT
jgi:hypothetical protein